MKRNLNISANLDWITVLIYAILVLIGWFNIYAAVYSEEHSSIFDIEQKYGKQMLWILASILLIFTVLLVDIKFFTVFSNILFALSVLMLFAVAFFGKEVNGARSWFEFGAFSLQPTEFAKIATALAVSKYISSYSVKMNNWKNIIFTSVIIMIPCIAIMLQPDPGSVLVFASFYLAFYREGFPGEILLFGIVLVTLFIFALFLNQLTIIIILTSAAIIIMAYVNKTYKLPTISALLIILGVLLLNYLRKLLFPVMPEYLVYLIVIGSVSIFLVIKAIIDKIPNITKIILFLCISISFTFIVHHVFENYLEPHHQQRINILLGKEIDAKGAGYNVNQSMIAIGSGGFFGKGYLQGTQTKYNFVPEQSTDFIFCTIGEEWGFVGSFILLSLFGALLIRILMIAERQKSTFSRVYGYCVLSIFLFHIIINIGMTIGILPVIGIPLPFISYGGSSLWAFTVLLFILLRLDINRYDSLR